MEKDLGAALSQTASNPDCMKECEAKGDMCKGIYVAKGGTDCHMVLEHGPGNGHLTSSTGNVGVNSDGTQKSVTVNVNVHNSHNNPDPTKKDGTWSPLDSSAKEEVKAAAKEAAKE